MQTILIPTDFRIAALDHIKPLCNQLKDTKVNLIFVHIFKLSDSITDLLMLARRSREYSFVSEKFREECDELKKKQRNLNSIKIDFFYGSTSAVFGNYLEKNAVDFILDPANCSVNKLNSFSIDPANLIQRSGYPLINSQSERKTINDFQEVLQEQRFEINGSLT